MSPTAKVILALSALAAGAAIWLAAKAVYQPPPAATADGEPAPPPAASPAAPPRAPAAGGDPAALRREREWLEAESADVNREIAALEADASISADALAGLSIELVATEAKIESHEAARARARAALRELPAGDVAALKAAELAPYRRLPEVAGALGVRVYEPMAEEDLAGELARTKRALGADHEEVKAIRAKLEDLEKDRRRELATVRRTLEQLKARHRQALADAAAEAARLAPRRDALAARLAAARRQRVRLSALLAERLRLERRLGRVRRLEGQLPAAG
jgi:hypothetical protein